ncbi:MAG: glutamate synthase domain-containing protein 2 [Planctomycetota bacterium]|jgi:glutamate synthase domain-containing protein 2
MRGIIFLVLTLVAALAVAAGLTWPLFRITWPIVVGLYILAFRDSMQKRHAVLRNFPIIGHFRYLLEIVRPEINQYFIESNTDGTPFSRADRSLVYQRAKAELDTLPFGTQRDVYEVGYEWIAHSFGAKHPTLHDPRILIGEENCSQPYESSLLNISAMSFGSLSSNAVRSLNLGAKAGGFAHNTGEGGISPHHLMGGDLIWQIGTGYFGCCDDDGHFNANKFSENAQRKEVKMIEIKLSQGAKPGHGGILPAAKLTPEIAAIRGVPLGKDVLSPPSHDAFHTVTEMLLFVVRLRELSGGKPVGLKLCIGSRAEFLSLCRAMKATDSHPDFITIDGGEGGTGAAPVEFSNSVGMPLNDAIIFVNNALNGFLLRDKIKLIASGKIVTGFDMISKLALGADACSAARSMMLALGCIQARRCNSNECPVGVATQHKGLVAGLDVSDKAPRVQRYHYETVESLMELLGAAGLDHPTELEPTHLYRRVGPAEVKTYADVYEYLEPGVLLNEPVPASFEKAWFTSLGEQV